MAALDGPQAIDLLRTLLAVVAGLWVVFLYRRRRQGKAVMRIGLACRVGAGVNGERRLFVRVHVANVSAVVLRDVEATMVVMVPVEDGSGELRFTVVHADNPLVYVTGDGRTTAGVVSFVPQPGQDLEPNECIESEQSIPLPQPAPSLIALRLWLIGAQGAAGWRREWEWGAFAFVDPDLLANEFRPVTQHGGNHLEVQSNA